jgi:hypothetical protein
MADHTSLPAFAFPRFSKPDLTAFLHFLKVCFTAFLHFYENCQMEPERGDIQAYDAGRAKP